MSGRGKQYDIGDCIEALQAAAERLGETPTMVEYNATGLSPSAQTISDRCGSWDRAVSMSDLEPVSLEQYTEEDCIQALQNYADTYGEEPTISKYDQSGYRPVSGTIAEKCGTWSEAKEKAGVVFDEEEQTPEEEADEMFDLLDQATPVHQKSDSTRE